MMQNIVNTQTRVNVYVGDTCEKAQRISRDKGIICCPVSSSGVHWRIEGGAKGALAPPP